MAPTRSDHGARLKNSHHTRNQRAGDAADEPDDRSDAEAVRRHDRQDKPQPAHDEHRGGHAAATAGAVSETTRVSSV